MTTRTYQSIFVGVKGVKARRELMEKTVLDYLFSGPKGSDEIEKHLGFSSVYLHQVMSGNNNGTVARAFRDLIKEGKIISTAVEGHRPIFSLPKVIAGEQSSIPGIGNRTIEEILEELVIAVSRKVKVKYAQEMQVLKDRIAQLEAAASDAKPRFDKLI